MAAAKLADQGQYSCRFCRKVKPIKEGIVVTWGGNVLFGLCPACYPGRPIVIKDKQMMDGSKGIFCGFLNESDIPSSPEILPASGMQDVEAIRAALPSREKYDFGGEK